jgi:hypothetical protein
MQNILLGLFMTGFTGAICAVCVFAGIEFLRERTERIEIFPAAIMIILGLSISPLIIMGIMMTLGLLGNR